MHLFSKIVNNITFSYQVAEIREGVAPMETLNTLVESNFLLQVNRGYYWEGKELNRMEEGTFYFVPKGHSMYFRMGLANEYVTFGREGYGGNEDVREQYSKRVNPLDDLSGKTQLHTILSFDALLYGTVPFFSVLGLPAVTLAHDKHLSYLLRELAVEESQNNSCKDAMLQSLTQQALIRICRYLDGRPEYSQYMERLKYLTDRRLIEIISYVRTHLDKDLSNKRLAAISFLSEDYIGQFFKALTGQNLQEYVERQRLEKARQLLLTTPDSIQAIAFQTGFRDPAYFSRRFKMLYLKNANEYRKS